MARLTMMLLALWATSAIAAPRDRIWLGRVSDEICAASHKDMATATGMSGRDCALTCTRSGARFVLVDKKGAVIPFVDQELPDLQKLADQEVKVTGQREGDAILITKIERIRQP
jgi:hypothetical protein